MTIKQLAVWEYPINDNNECNNYHFLTKRIQLSLEQLTLVKNQKSQ